MPTSGRGFIAWVIGTLIVVAVGVAILSRVPMVWGFINKT